MNSLSQSGASLVVSVVSHGHGISVQSLLNDIARHHSALVKRVVLTQNLPEAVPVAPSFCVDWPFTLEVRRNAHPLGFGANHNRALLGANESCVCILNPDVALMEKDPFFPLVAAALDPGVGCAYPLHVNEGGHPEDSERELPTPAALWRRRALRRRERRVDWVNAACMVLPRTVWESLGGFDEAYFMYCEDVDLCLRVRLKGWTLVQAPAQVVHVGQRASHRRWSHLAWHVRSLLRLWSSPVYRQAKTMLSVDTSAQRTIGRS